MSAPFTTKEIRKVFPNPITFLEGSMTEQQLAENYCVGGAMCLFAAQQGVVDEPSRFPYAEELEPFLLTVNPSLADKKSEDGVQPLAYHFAEEIAGLNDEGEFEQAWAVLERALRYGGD